MSKIGPSGQHVPPSAEKAAKFHLIFLKLIISERGWCYASFESKHGYQSLTFTKNVFLHIGQQIMTIKEVYESHNKIEQMTTE